MNNPSFAIRQALLSNSQPHPIISPYIGVHTTPLHVERGRRLYNFYDVKGVRLNRGEVIYETVTPFAFRML
jgi:hypothetical protein